MPGIVGIISKLCFENKEELDLMISCMMHEPFYVSGTYIAKNEGLYAGWVCHKDSFSDCMPVFNEKKDVLLIFVGENFADRDVLRQLKRKGHEFDEYNASYLIHLYEEDEENFFLKLNGWFCGLLVDLRKRKTVLLNDRYGMGRIYYYEGKEAFYFASEAKALLKVCPELRAIDLRALGEFFTCGCVLENRTFSPRIFLLPGGSAWSFHDGDINNIKRGSYFKPTLWENQPVLGKEEFYKELKETLITILPRYFHSKLQIAMSLTGGLDTRMIMAYMNKKPGELPCYTYGGMFRDCYDIKIAGKVADVCNQTHEVLRLDDTFLSKFRYFAEKTIYVTDGCVDICGAHEIYLSKLAREIRPIRMTGNYGGELLRGINYINANSPCHELFHPDFLGQIENALRTFENTCIGNQVSYAAFKLIPWHLFGLLACAQSEVTLRTPYMDNELVRLMYQAPSFVRDSNEMSLRLIAENNTLLYNIRTDLGFGGKSNFLLSKYYQIYYSILFKAEWYFNDGMPHWLTRLDARFKPLHLEGFMIGRHKIEHYRIWFRNQVSSYVQEVLLDGRTAARTYLNKKFLEQMVRHHIDGHRNYRNEISKTITAELIYRLFIE